MRVKRFGFTLVELLVVIGIVALLISILLPALGRARDSARQQVCASNLHQLAIAAFSYAADSKGCCVPTGVYAVNGKDTLNGITGAAVMSWDYEEVTGMGTSEFSFLRGYLGPYVKADLAIRCPEIDRYNLPITSVAQSYAIALLGANKITQLTASSETPVFCDAISFSAGVLGRPTEEWRPYSYASIFDAFQGRHTSRGVGNVAFYDGHVQAIPAQLRPANTYSSAPSAARLLVAQQLHIGPLYGKPIDWSQISDAATYAANCASTYDYYFWLNKQTHTLN